MNPQYPIYIISKGRWESRKTSRALEKMNVPYHIVIESQEYDQYAIDGFNVIKIQNVELEINEPCQTAYNNCIFKLHKQKEMKG